ncbi:MAG: DapH/DapD/GlmU-related protein [Pseudomonadota bacterium]
MTADTTPKAAHPLNTRPTPFTHTQDSAYSTPWSRKSLLAKALFDVVWMVACRWTPRPMKGYRNAVLKAFGAKIEGAAFVDASARIHFPWQLVLKDRACIAKRVDVYNLATITLEARSTVAQDTMLCCGTHDFASPKLELMTAPIVIGEDAFVGARAIILPGVRVADRAIVGAGAVLSGPTQAGMVYAGNPAKQVGERRARAKA